jgi:hypothetical protein
MFAVNNQISLNSNNTSLESNNQVTKNPPKINSVDQEIQKLKTVISDTTPDENFIGGPLVRSKSIRAFKGLAPSHTLLEEGKKNFDSTLNFEMMSFLFDELLLDNGLSRNDIEKCHLLIPYYLKQVVKKFPELEEAKYQNQLKITALVLACKILISTKKILASTKEIKDKIFELKNILTTLNTLSKSLLFLIYGSSNPSLKHLKSFLFCQKMNQPESLSHLEQILLSTENYSLYKDRQQWFNKVLGATLYLFDKPLDLDTDLEQEKVKFQTAQTDSMLKQGQELFAPTVKIDSILFRNLFNKIVDTSYYIQTTMTTKGGQEISVEENEYYSFIIDYYVQKVIDKEEFLELKENKYKDGLETTALLLAYKLFSFKEDSHVSLISILYEINERSKSLLLELASTSTENLSPIAKEKLLTTHDHALKLGSIYLSTQNYELYAAREAWLLATMNWRTYIPDTAIQEYFKNKKEKLEKFELEQLKFLS